MNLLKNSSPISEHPPNINVILKNHQLSMLQRCKDIENMDKNNFGITGELNFSGRITEIGGLEYKFLGSIKCGIKKFIYPKANQSDYEKFMEKYKNNKLIKGIIFYPVSTIKEVFDLILESN